MMALMASDIHDGDGWFGREAQGISPKVVVEHEVADYADAGVAQARDQAFEARDCVHGLGAVGHRYS